MIPSKVHSSRYAKGKALRHAFGPATLRVMRLRGSLPLGALLFAVPAAVSITVLTSCGGKAAPPQQQIDVVSIRSELLTIGQAERQYFVAHSTYGTLDDLEREQLLTGGANRR